MAGRYKIVIADDQSDVRDLLALRLSLVPALDAVGQAADGREAIDLARSLAPDLMTLDLRMPVMGGIEAMPMLRAAAPRMKIVVFSSDVSAGQLTGGQRPDAFVTKGGALGDLVAVVVGLLAEGGDDVVQVDLGRLPVQVVLDAFDSWVGLNSRVRAALATEGDTTVDLLGDVPLDSSDLLCLMGVFMQFGLPLLTAKGKGSTEVDLRFLVRRDAGAAARRALLALGGNGTLRAFNKAWSHSPTHDAQEALELVDSMLVDQ